MIELDAEMRRALRADAEKLSAMTGDNHTVEFWDSCPECGGLGEWEVSHPLRDDPYFMKPAKCDACNGTGFVCL